MKKVFTFILFATLLCSSAFAEGDDNYYWFYAKATVATTGKGLIYLSESDTIDAGSYSDESEAKAYGKGYNSYSFFYHAKPADGYEFVGLFPTATPKSMAERSTRSNEIDGTVSVKTSQTTADDNVEGYGFEPDTTFYAVFSKVYVNVASTMTRAGKVDIDKVINDKGDKVTISATPTIEGSEFDYWEDSFGNKITENPYSFTVGDDQVVYTAYFKGKNILKLDFGEGKFIPFSANNEAEFEEGIETYIVNELEQAFYDADYNKIQFVEAENAWGYYTTEKNDKEEDVDVFVPYRGTIPQFNSNYQVYKTVQFYIPNAGFVLYGEGEKTVVLYRETADDQLIPIDNYLVGTSTGAVNIESLPAKDANENKLVYYIFDTNAFVKATAGTVAENSCYLVLTDGVQFPLPEKIYMRAEDDPNAISDVNADKKVTFIGVYNINGQEVEAPIKGINIINGKKVLVK